MLQDPRHPHEAGQVLPLVAVIVMLAGVLVLAAETIVSNRLSRRTNLV